MKPPRTERLAPNITLPAAEDPHGRVAAGTVLSGRYRLDRQLGAGGMGQVWIAEHLGLGAPVAVKLIHSFLADAEENARRFAHEAHALSLLPRPLRHKVVRTVLTNSPAMNSPFPSPLPLRSRRVQRALAFAAIVGALTAQRQASAQETQNVDLPKFNPSFAGDRFFGVASPYTASDGVFNVHGGLLVDYAHNPLVLASADGSTLGCGSDECSIVEHQLFLHLNVTGVLFDRVALNVDMPFALFEAGEGTVQGGDLSFTSPDGPAIGDLRIGARVRLFGEYFDPFQIGIGGYVWTPTGSDGAYVTDQSVRGQPHALIGGRADRFIWSVMAGPTFRGATQIGNVATGHQFNWGAGLGVLLLDDRTLQLGLESTGAVSFSDVDTRNTNAEAQAGIKYRFLKFMEVGAAAGPGFTNGVGTPDARALFSLQYTPEPEQKLDRDHDGVLDSEDACPDTPGLRSDDPKKNGCPDGDRDKDGVKDSVDACIDTPGVASDDPKKNGCPLPGDRDKDGVLDTDDACPDTPGEKSDDPKKNGCPPPDTDGDGILDRDDACVEVKGVKTDDPKTNGCPPDTDGDGIRDDKDACPADKGVPSEDPKRNGCPEKVIVTDNEIVILEQVQFDTAKATIKKVSDPLLDSVASVLKSHPEILKIEVQGHTDSRGSKQVNRTLSENRAKAVVAALVKRGIDEKRLTAKGYGPDKPLDTAENEAAWQKNRRVQFVVLEKAASKTQVLTK